MSFNSAQILAITHTEGPCMVLAGPGSGKTTVITRRIESLIQDHKVSPEEILVITFSKAAAKEMRERFFALSATENQGVTFGTFHGVYYGILRWAYQFNQKCILSEKEKLSILRQVCETRNTDYREDLDFLKSLAEEIGIVKNNLISLDAYGSTCCEADRFCQIYRLYEEMRTKRRKMDFDDMLLMTYQLFQERPDLLHIWQKKFRYIMVDEFQDINQVQYEVLKMLAAPRNNLFIVGDDDQSIYQFRGAKPEIMANFQNDFPQAKQVILGLNYRSTNAIVTCAGKLIAHNQNRFHKEISTENEQGGKVEVVELEDAILETEYIMKAIKTALNKGLKGEEIAVIFRTKTQARLLVETLMEYQVPFSIEESPQNLYAHFICEDLRAYLQMAGGDRSRSLFLKVMNHPNRYIGRESVDRDWISFSDLTQFYQDKAWMVERIDTWKEDLEVLREMAPYGAIQYIRKKIGYDAFLAEYARTRNLKLDSLMEIMSEIEESTKRFRTTEEWFAHMEAYTAEMKNKKQQDSAHAVSLMTMHGSKGLEFHTVFLMGANETICPHKKAKLPEEIEEERRLFYVAMTRAKKRLVITYAKERNGKKRNPSRFLSEMDSDYSSSSNSSNSCSSNHSSNASAAASYSSSSSMFSNVGSPSSVSM